MGRELLDSGLPIRGKSWLGGKGPQYWNLASLAQKRRCRTGLQHFLFGTGVPKLIEDTGKHR